MTATIKATSRGPGIEVEAVEPDRRSRQWWRFGFGGYMAGGYVLLSYDEQKRPTPRHKWRQSQPYSSLAVHLYVRGKDGDDTASWERCKLTAAEVPLPDAVIEAARAAVTFTV
jgi:hypothetical protein